MLPLRVLLAQLSGRISTPTPTPMSWLCLRGPSAKTRKRESPVGLEIPLGIPSEGFLNALEDEEKRKLDGKKGVNPYLNMIRI